MLGVRGIWGAMFLSLIVSFFAAIFFLITKKKSKKDEMAFGPALAIGTFLAIFFDRNLVKTLTSNIGIAVILYGIFVAILMTIKARSNQQYERIQKQRKPILPKQNFCKE